MNISRQHWIVLCCGMLGIVSLTLYSLTHLDIVVREEVIASSSGHPIRIRLMEPVFQTFPVSQQHPAVIAIPPYNIPADVMEILCAELAHRGVACAIPDFFGKAPQESRQNMGSNSLDIMTQDVLSLAEFLRTLSWIDPGKIGICGHSVGGTVAFLAALEDPTIRAVVPIGMETEMPPRHPQNLLLLAGLYDEIRTPRALLKRLVEYQVSTDPQFYTLYGDFSSGTARQVSISPTSDHFIEPMDSLIIRQTLRWYASAFEWSALEGGNLKAWWYEVGRFFVVLAVTGFYAFGIMHVFLRSSIVARSTQFPLWLALRIQFLPLPFLVITAWWAGNQVQSIRPFAPDIMVSLLFAHLLTSVWIRKTFAPQNTPVRSVRSLGVFIFALGIAFLLTCLLTNLMFFVRFPSALAWYPVFILNMLVLFPLQLWMRVVAALFADTLTACTPNLWYGAVFLGIIVVLDWPIRLLNYLAERCIAACQKKLRLFDAAFSPVKWIVFLLVWGVFAGLAYRRMTEGMLTAETIHAGLGLLLQLILLPGLIFWLLVRMRIFRRIKDVVPIVVKNNQCINRRDTRNT